MNGNSVKVRKIKWKEIEAAYVYKRDAFTTDLICLAFQMPDGSSIEFNESMAGWQYMIENLREYLTNCVKFSDWFTQVAFPAFKVNLIEIYKK